jgi:hypothetical protein
MTRDCEVCGNPVPIFKRWCGKICAKKGFGRENVPTLSPSAKKRRKLDLMAWRPSDLFSRGKG